MRIIVNQTERIRQLETENILLRQENEKLRADADYIAMMADVELEADIHEQEI